jgi:hypothetical protein
MSDAAASFEAEYADEPYDDVDEQGDHDDYFGEEDMSQMEILELEMRARAIKAMIKAQVMVR